MSLRYGRLFDTTVKDNYERSRIGWLGVPKLVLEPIFEADILLVSYW